MFVEGVYVQGVQALASSDRPKRWTVHSVATAAWSHRTAGPDDLLRALEAEFPDARHKLESYGARF